MNKEELKKHISNIIDERKQVYIDLCQNIYQNPETGYKEIKTTKTIADALEQLGYRTKRDIAVTGCHAYSNEEKIGPKISIIGELDSIICPSHKDCDQSTGAMHACGHNIQITVMYAVADALKYSNSLGYLDGKIDFIAVPAEEVIELEYRKRLKDEGKIKYYSGKTELITKGEFDDSDICMMVHNYPFENGYHKIAPYVTSNGFIGKQTTFIGKQSHAGQAPWDGINSLNMASLAITNMHYQRETFKDKDTVRVHQIINHGGDIVNSVPDRVSMETTVRANNIPALFDANNKVNRSIHAACIALGGKAKIIDSPGQLPINSDKQLSEIFKNNALKFYKEDEILPHMQWTASSDMGDISALKPVLHGLTSGITGGLHTKDYQITDEENAYIIPIKIMCFTIIDLLMDNAIMAKNIINDFKPSMNKDEYIKYLKDIEKEYTFE